MDSPTIIPAAPASYAEHVGILCGRYKAALAHCGLDAVVVAAGNEIPVFLDDQHYRFRANPHFVQWLPLSDQPNAWLIIARDEQPRLIILQPADFWHASPELPDDSYLKHFDVTVCTDPAEARRLCEAVPTATTTIDPQQPDATDESLLKFLHYYRAVKTGYEVECLRQATAVAVKAHSAAKATFENGGSEFEIHCAFVQATGMSGHELPYPDIVACNENAAVLHYQKRTHSKQPRSLLIDAGCAVNGYASDITRTYSAADDDFAALIRSLETVQQQLCNEVTPGLSFGELHHAAHVGIAEILKAHDIISLPSEQAVKEKVTAAFFPHGLGHFLGIQVHDVGGHMADVNGTQAPPPADYPHLRMTRTLEPGMVITMEPGLYFIDMLLEKFRDNPAFNWQRIDELRPYGGIRIEDNLVITESGCENLTRS